MEANDVVAKTLIDKLKDARHRLTVTIFEEEKVIQGVREMRRKCQQGVEEVDAIIAWLDENVPDWRDTLSQDHKDHLFGPNAMAEMTLAREWTNAFVSVGTGVENEGRAIL